MIRIVPPKPGTVCHNRNGCRVELEDGTEIPSVLSVQISMDADDIVKATIEVMADVSLLDILPQGVTILMVESDGMVEL